MNLKSYVKDKILTIILLCFAIGTIEILLMPYRLGAYIKLYIPIAILGGYFISFIIDYQMKKHFYKHIENTLEELEEKYLIAEIIKQPTFLEGKMLKEIIMQINKSMIENVNKYKYRQEEYKDYIELWIHEIKLPIASRQTDSRK